jgi:hypothetical protein
MHKRWLQIGEGKVEIGMIFEEFKELGFKVFFLIWQLINLIFFNVCNF